MLYVVTQCPQNHFAIIGIPEIAVETVKTLLCEWFYEEQKHGQSRLLRVHLTKFIFVFFKREMQAKIKETQVRYGKQMLSLGEETT